MDTPSVVSFKLDPNYQFDLNLESNQQAILDNNTYQEASYQDTQQEYNFAYYNNNMMPIRKLSEISDLVEEEYTYNLPTLVDESEMR